MKTPLTLAEVLAPTSKQNRIGTIIESRGGLVDVRLVGSNVTFRNVRLAGGSSPQAGSQVELYREGSKWVAMVPSGAASESTESTLVVQVGGGSSQDHAAVSIGAGGSSSLLSINASQVLTMSQLTTSVVTEGSNLYYTDARARAAISVADTNSIDLTYSSGQISAALRLDGSTLTVGVNGAKVTDNTYVPYARQVIAGNGLTGGGSLGSADITLNVVGGTLITANLNDVALSNGTAQYQVPLTGATPFTPAWSTASSSPGAAVAILRTDASGYLQLVRLGVGVSPSYRLHAADTGGTQLRLDYDGSNTTTFGTSSTGILTIQPSGTAIYTTAYFGIGVNPALNPLHIRAAGTQVRLDYDGTYNTTLATGATGNLTITPSGGTVAIAGAMTLTGDVAVNGGDITASAALNITPANGALTLNPSSGDIVLSPSTNMAKVADTARIQSSGYASRTTGWAADGAGAGDFRYLYADEMHVKAFIADLEQALAGGQIITKSVAKVQQDFTLPAAGNSGNLYVEEFAGFVGQVFANSDIVLLRQISRQTDGSLTVANAWGSVTYVTRTAPNGTTPGYQQYTFTRSASYPGTATGTIYAQTLALDFGQSSGGYHEISAVDGTWAATNAPYSQVVTWSTHPGAGVTVRTRLGNLRGVTSTTEYGLYAGQGFTADATSKYIRLSDQNVEIHNMPVNLYQSSTITVSLNPTAPSLAIGNPLPTAYGTNTGIWMGNDGGTYKARIGNPSGARMVWDGSQLILYSTSTNYVQLNGTDIGMYIGGNRHIYLDATNSKVIIGRYQVTNNSWIELASTGISFMRRSSMNEDIAMITMTAATGNMTLEGVMQLNGNGSIITHTSPNSRIEITTNGLIAYSSGSTQALSISTGGTLVAGTGVITIDGGGVQISLPAAYANSNSFRFTGSSLFHGLYGYRETSPSAHNYAILMVDSTTVNETASVYVQSRVAATYTATTSFSATSGSTYSQISMTADSNATAGSQRTVTITSDYVDISNKITFGAVAVANLYRSSSTLITDAMFQHDDNVGINVAPSSSYALNSVNNGTTASLYGNRFAASSVPTGNDTGKFTMGVLGAAYLDAAYNWGTLYAGYFQAVHNSTAGKINTLVGVTGLCSLSNTGGTAVSGAGNMYGLYAPAPSRGAGSSMTADNATGLKISNQGAAWITGTAYGIHIDAQSGAGTAEYPIYSVDTVNPCYFGADIYVRGKAKGVGAQLIDFTTVTCGAALDLSTSLTDVNSMTYTADLTNGVAEYWYVWLYVSYNLGAGTAACNAGDVLYGRLKKDDVAESRNADWIATTTVGSGAGIQFYKLSMAAGSSHTIHLEASNNTGNRGRVGTGTMMVVWRVAQ